MLDLLIVGAGPIGLFAAFEAGAKKLKTEVIESLNYVGGQLTTLYPEKPIYDFPGYKNILAKDLIKELYNQYSQFEKEVPINFATTLISINKKDDHYEVLTNKKTFETKTILLTTGNGGFNPRRLPLEGEDKISNLSYSLIDINRYKNKDVLILGGGDSALDFGNMLKGIAKNLTISHRRNDFRAAEDSVSKFKEHGKIYTPYTPTILNYTENKGTSLVLENVETKESLSLYFDELIVSYGFLPSKINYESLGIETVNNDIKVSTNMETSVQNIFACGNCVTYNGKIKTLACGMGETSVALHSIESVIYPNKSKLAGYFHPTK